MLIVTIHNDGTGTPIIANYDYEVRVNDRLIASGRIKGHDRRKGWRNLVNMLSRQHNTPDI